MAGCVFCGENVLLIVNVKKPTLSFLVDLSLFVIKDAHSPLCTRKHVLLDSASEPINILFLSTKLSFLDSWIMFTDSTSSTHIFTESCFDSHGLIPTYFSHFILYYLPLLCSHIVRSNHIGWICQSCSCFSTFGFAIFLPKMFYFQFFSHLRHFSLKYCIMQLKYHPLCPPFYCHSQFTHTHYHYSNDIFFSLLTIYCLPLQHHHTCPHRRR